MLRIISILFLFLPYNQALAGDTLPNYKPGEVIVKYASDPRSKLSSLRMANNVMGNVEVKGYEIKEYQHNLNMGRFKVPSYKSVEIAVKELREMDGVEYAEPNYKVTFNNQQPSDLDWNELKQKNVDFFPQEKVAGSSEAKIIVAIIDTGVDYNHEALAPYIWENKGEIPGNGIDDDRNGYTDDVNGYNFVNNNGNPMDDNYHGTHVAGIVLNTLVEAERESPSVGSLKNLVAIMPLKFLDKNGEGYVSDAVRSISYAVNMGARVLNNSWGGGNYSRALADAIALVYNSNRLFVAAAGNDKKNNDQYPLFPASYTHPNLISVAALDGQNGYSMAWFSNFGVQSVDIGAPGVSIRSTFPDGRYGKLSGTSMSTPYVSGAAAALWITNNSLNHLQVKQIILSSASYISSLSSLILTPGKVDTVKGVEIASVTTGDPNVPRLVLPPPPSQSVGYYDGEDLMADTSTGCASAPWLLLPYMGTKPPRPDFLFLILPFLLLIIARFRPLKRLVRVFKRFKNN